MLNTIDPKSNTRSFIKWFGWSVLMIEDGFGFGFVAQPTAENADAMRDGWALVTDGLSIYEACKLRDELKDDASMLDLAVY